MVGSPYWANQRIPLRSHRQSLHPQRVVSMSKRNRGPSRLKDTVPWWTAQPELLTEVRNEVEHNHPLLRVVVQQNYVSVVGLLKIEFEEQTLASFKITILFPPDYPNSQPSILETGNRIPKELKRHINSTHGDACLMVPEEWDYKSKDNPFSSFMAIPVRNFFVGQLYYEVFEKFPHGERQYGYAGLVQAYSEMLRTNTDLESIIAHLTCLTPKQLKGHFICPCGSNKPLRDCCYAKVEQLPG